MNEYANYLNNLQGKILLGCDGFVDETYEIVEERTGPETFRPMTELKTFGQLLLQRSDGGVGLEINPKRRCEGGFAINTGRIAGCLGLRPTLPGLYGEAQLDPAFAPFEDICELIPLGQPALTIALEFGDGKILLSDLQAIASLTWQNVEDQLGPERIASMFTDVDILGLGYWSATAHFDDLFLGFMRQYENRKAPRRMFFDFADIQKKSPESFLRSLELIAGYNTSIPMTLSLNEHEVFELCRRIGQPCNDASPAGVASALGEARRVIGFDELVVHTPEFGAASSSSDGEAIALQERQKKVIRLAGAGDSFNGGYVCASLGQLSLKQRLVVANATTAFFVTHGTGPTTEQLVEQIAAAKDR